MLKQSITIIFIQILIFISILLLLPETINAQDGEQYPNSVSDYEDRWIPLGADNKRLEDVHYNSKNTPGAGGVVNFWQFEKERSYQNDDGSGSLESPIYPPPEQSTPISNRRIGFSINTHPFVTVFHRGKIIHPKPKPKAKPKKPPRGNSKRPGPPHQQYAPAFISYGPIYGPPPPGPVHNNKNPQQKYPSAPPLPPSMAYNQPSQSYSNNASPSPMTSYSNVSPTYGPPIQGTTASSLRNYNYQQTTTSPYPMQNYPKPTYGPPIQLQNVKMEYEKPQKSVLKGHWDENTSGWSNYNRPQNNYVRNSNSGWDHTTPQSSNNYAPPRSSSGWSSPPPISNTYFPPSSSGWSSPPPISNTYIPPSSTGWSSPSPQPSISNSYIPPTNSYNSKWSSSNTYIPPTNSYNSKWSSSNTYIPPTNSYNRRPSSRMHSSPPSSSTYNPPMNFGQPMHNFGPPKSSYGQPPPIIGEKPRDIYDTNQGIYRYGNDGDEHKDMQRYDNNGYSSGYQENIQNPNSYSNTPDVNVYQLPKKNYYRKKKSTKSSKSSTPKISSSKNDPVYYNPSTNAPNSDARPTPHYDTNYNSPGLYLDPKITDWMPYNGKEHYQVMNKHVQPRYKTLPDRIDEYESDPEHEKYPKITYDDNNSKLRSRSIFQKPGGIKMTSSYKVRSNN